MGLLAPNAALNDVRAVAGRTKEDARDPELLYFNRSLVLVLAPFVWFG